MPNKETTQVVCVAEFRAKEGKTDELIAAVARADGSPRTRSRAASATN